MPDRDRFVTAASYEAALACSVERTVRPSTVGTVLATLSSITQQQLARAAADAIHTRLVVALDGQVAPERILATPTQTLRDAGLSAGKAASLPAGPG